MNNLENNEMFDLGSLPVSEDFDPFALDAEAQQPQENYAASEYPEMESSIGDMPAGTEPGPNAPEAVNTPEENNVPETTAAPEKSGTSGTKVPETKGMKAVKPEQGFEEKLPVFAYAGATENISDISTTFEELRIEKSLDFPELEDGKRVSWTVEYGKITKAVTDPKGTSIGRMKADIEASKEFLTGLKRAKEKNPVCRIKPRVTAQSKGTVPAYKGIFPTLEEAEAAGKVISIVPARDGRVYEIRNTEMGRFITPSHGCEMLSEVQAGFTPVLPRIPMELTMQAFAFFRHFIQRGSENEALLNIYWDKEAQEFLADAPEQVVSKISVNSRISGKFTDERYIHYMDIHSHNTMKAFFSSVDDHDEKATRLYTVVGRLDKGMPEIKTRISNGGKFMDIDPASVFELPDVSFPDVWAESVDISRKDRRTVRKALLHIAKMEKKAERKMKKKAGAL